MLEYAGVCWSMLEYARVCQSMPEYARVPASPSYDGRMIGRRTSTYCGCEHVGCEHGQPSVRQCLVPSRNAARRVLADKDASLQRACLVRETVVLERQRMVREQQQVHYAVTTRFRAKLHESECPFPHSARPRIGECSLPFPRHRRQVLTPIGVPLPAIAHACELRTQLHEAMPRCTRRTKGDRMHATCLSLALKSSPSACTTARRGGELKPPWPKHG